MSSNVCIFSVCVYRICHCEGDDECPLIMPCRCTGSLSFVHQACLNQWIKSSDTRCCELCKFDFVMEMKLKPLRKVCTHFYSTQIVSGCNIELHLSLPSTLFPSWHLVLICLSSPFCLHPFFYFTVGEAAHVEEWEEKDLLFSVVSPDSNSVYVVVSLHPGQENRRRN